MRAAFLGVALVLGLAAACSSAGGAGADDPPGGGGTSSGTPGGSGGSGGEGGEAGEGGAGGGVNLAGSTGSGGEKACQAKETPGKRVPAALLVVLDRSGSMNDNNKWSSAVSALNQMLATADQELGMGILRYPENTNAPGCPVIPDLLDPDGLCKFNTCTKNHGCVDIKQTPHVPVAPLKTSAAQIQSLMASTKPGGETPTLGALQVAYKYMQELQTDSERFVLLVTDGVPTFAGGPEIGCPLAGETCGTKAQLGTLTSDARKGNPPVRTFVIGAPGSEGGLEILSGLALNGGTCRPGGSHSSYTCHYQIGAANFQQELAATLTQIAGSVSNCTYAVPVPSDGKVDPDKVNVVVTTAEGETVVLKDTDQQDGWDYTDDSKTKIEIFGPQCEAINKGTSATVKIALGCKTEVK
jgi:Mg-chelatase subunit ChlD